MRGIKGQVEAEQRTGAAWRRVGEPDRASVQAGDPTGDGESESGAAGVAIRRGERPEPLEGALPVRGRDTRTAVGDVQPPPIADDCAGDADPATLGAVSDRVVENVREQLAQPGAVGVDVEVLGQSDVELDRSAGGHQVRDDLVDQGAEIDRCEPQRCDPGLHPGEVEQVIEQGTDPPGLRDRGVEVRRVGG